MPGDTMSNKEAIEMMNRCKAEIRNQRAEIERLRPKAEAYDNLAIVLSLLPQRSMGMGEDLIWVLNKRIDVLEQAEAKAPDPKGED